MSSISMRIGVTLSIGLMLLAAACTDARKGGTVFDSKTGKHPDNWVADHPAAFLSDSSQCTSCHGSDLRGGISGVSCYSASFNGMSCHANGPSGHPAGWNDPTQHGVAAKAAPSSSTGFASCELCHGADFSGSFARTCLNTAGCHGAGVDSPHAFPWQSTSTRKHSTTDPGNAAVCGLCHLGNRQPPAYATFSQTVGCFDNTLCHGQVGHAVGWANPDVHGAAAKSAPSATAMQGFSTCQTCHGANFAGAAATTCLNSAACHGAGVNSPHAFPWQSTSTRKHSTTNVANASACGLCHLANRQPPSYVVLTVPVGCFDNTLCHGQVGHAAGWANPDTHGAAAKSAPSATAMQGFSTCQTCHGANFAGGAATTCLNTVGCHGAAVDSPHSFPWQSTSTRKHSTTNMANAAVCGLCHWNNVQPPTYSTPVPGTPNCFDNTLCHGAVTRCVDCHASAQTGTHGTPRDAVVGEFGLAWGHKKSGRGAVTDADCIVCHLEGNYATQARSALHGDGNIDLRDPDGAGETPITNMTGGAFTFTKFATSYAAGSRTSTGNTSNSVDNVLTQKFCLACHDSNGATNPTVRTPGGTAFMPWGGVNLGANYTVANGAAAVGGIVDVKTQLATSNRSWHPVLGPKNRDFPTAARMNDPYKPTGTRGTAGTLSQGVVMNCFDCHNVSGASPLTTRTVAAHGNAQTIRGVATVSGTPSATNDVTFCKVCHAGYVTGSSQHGAGSALSSGTDGGMTAYLNYGCNICHSSGYATAVPRPIRAQDTHGSNALGTVGTLLTATSRWSTDPTPVAFIRNRQVLPQHQPKRIGATTFTNPTCMGGNVSPCSQGSQNYSVGGTY